MEAGRRPARNEAIAMKLQTNENPADRVVRVALGLVLILAFAAGWATAPLSFLALAVGAIALVTGLAGFCPLYAVLGVSTCRVRR
jgi:hypothetical protein